jgi:hypothetical protein
MHGPMNVKYKMNVKIKLYYVNKPIVKWMRQDWDQNFLLQFFKILLKFQIEQTKNLDMQSVGSAWDECVYLF